MLRRSFLTGAAAALAAPAFAQPAAARVLRYVPQTDLTVLDPVFTTAYITRHHALMIYDQLYGLDAQLRPQPQMVEGHETEGDGLTWRFRLREGLKFHDGEPVRGRDCIASIRRWAQRDGLGQVLLARVAEMTAPDDRSFTIRLNQRFGPMLETLAKIGPSALFVMPERIAATDANTQIKEVIGSGPFRFVAAERVVGARVVYERNADYVPREGTPSWAAGPKRVFFDRVEWTVMPDPGTAAAALQNGEVDWWENPPNDLAPMLKRSRDVVLKRGSPLGTIGTGIFNTLHPPFDKPAVRRAILRAMSQQDFMTAAAGADPSLWNARAGVFTPGTPLATEAGIEAIAGPRDLERSKRELREAGYQGEAVVLLAPSDQQALMAIAEVQNDLFRRLGMNVDYRVSDWGTLVQRRASKESPEKGGWSMFHTTWNGLDGINPGVMTYLRANGERAWFGWPSVPRLDELRTAWFDAADFAAQQAIAAQIQQVVFEEAPYLPTGQYFANTAYRRTITEPVSEVFAFWGVRRV
ncbi:ABC transporter substrate-binding protein [Paracraurococcus lichenis]|uniref:ABC transporter substrate-binding protein n=1 Tax=Paracraurococcus lichenis TaxID=3064888 RepID=A0ABT9E5D6_9PROT|nr:ABC transporter substrate-binding protein [Paracraurococcus sp. LOR1-02]MDO9711382.1 ABC transporter substrate-binding protein [Paracraurococcus sp. LOR1-02]